MIKKAKTIVDIANKIGLGIRPEEIFIEKSSVPTMVKVYLSSKGINSYLLYLKKEEKELESFRIKGSNTRKFEMHAVCNSLFNQVPSEIDDSNEVYSHVRFRFKKAIDPILFSKHFSGLNKLDYSLVDDSLVITKEGISRFNDIIKSHFQILEMELNHKKYEWVIT